MTLGETLGDWEDIEPGPEVVELSLVPARGKRTVKCKQPSINAQCFYLRILQLALHPLSELVGGL